MRKTWDSGGEREREREGERSQEMQRGRADAHSGLSGHLFTLYKDIWAWRAATQRAAIHQSGGGPSQIHQESPLLLAELETICLPTAFPTWFFFFFSFFLYPPRRSIILGYVFPLLFFTGYPGAKKSPHGRRKGFMKKSK